MKFDHKWDLQWYEDRLKGRENTFRFVADMCKMMKCETVLDVGGGAGLLRRFLTESMKLDVVDRSPSGKEAGEELFQDVGFITGGIENTQGNYDAVVGIQLVEHMNGYESFLKSAWDKAEKVVVATFRNGLNGERKTRLQKRCDDYWDNQYCASELIPWTHKELHPLMMAISQVNVDRDYSPELAMVLYKE